MNTNKLVKRFHFGEIASATLLILLLFVLLFLRGSTPFDPQVYWSNRFARSPEIRSFIIDQIWSGEGLPTDSVEVLEDTTEPLHSATNLRQVEQLSINMGNGFISRPHIFYPRIPNKRLALVHQGHNSQNYEDFGLGDTIRELVDEGYTVVAFVMPGDPPLTGVHISYPQPTEHLNYLRYYVEPVIRTLNWLANQQWERIGMTGISGGGWTTTLASAIDERIEVSVPVAGSMPHNSYVEGDWEQQLPGLLPVDYLDLYLLAVTEGRHQVQILNVHDSCCFDYRRYQRIFPYDRIVSRIAADHGGQWQLVWDDTHQQHTISEFSREIILQTLSENR